MSREAAYGALFSLLQGISAFSKVSRVLETLEGESAANLPACYMRVTAQSVKPTLGAPLVRHNLGAAIYIYAASPDRNIASGIVLNNLIDEVEAALAPAGMMQVQTLGGAVAHAWVEGTVDVYEAVKSQRAAALIPVKMMLP
jgi:hypothetical protein